MLSMNIANGQPLSTRYIRIHKDIHSHRQAVAG